ncbi:hypothetical protein A7D23_03045 [Dehalobacter sp. TeCB1]|nr:hypothetical protein A7D23_03045 [Dehalobacter sp. TeCB1]
MNGIIRYNIPSILKTIYINFKYLNFRQAIKFPIIVSRNVVFLRAKGKIKIEGDLSFGMIKIGFSTVGIIDLKSKHTMLEIIGELIFKGSAIIGTGSNISVSGKLSLGNNFKISANSNIYCTNEIVFGNDCLVSWDCLFMDTDSHDIIDNDTKEKINFDKEILIGDRVWFGCRVLVLKGTSLKSDVIIASSSLLNKCYDGNNVLIGGIPARIIRSGVSWRI